MQCPQCAHDNPAGSRFCQRCGGQTGHAAPPAASAVGFCPRCGARETASLRFCPECGLARDGEAQLAPPQGVPPSYAPPPGDPRVRFGQLAAGSPIERAVEAARPSFVEPVRLVSILKDGSDGVAYPFAGDSMDIGRVEGDIILADDPYLSPRHARLRQRGDGYIVQDLDSVNGVYVRLREPRELTSGDTILMGQQVLRFDLLRDGELPLGPATVQGVYVFGTPEVPRVARLVQYTTEGVGRDVHYLYRGDTILGREIGDIVFTDDPFLSRRHASITLDPATRRFVLTDMDSSNGTALRIHGEHALAFGDQLRVGKHLFRLDAGSAQGKVRGVR
jgi:pSer/pThr/pTyr-binding forkhead associated (FHA) protein